MSALLPDIAGFGEESQLPSRVSLSVAVTFKLSKKLWKMMTSIGSFSGVVTGRLIGLPGKAADQNLNVTINLPNNAKHKCRKQECKISMCLTFHGSSMLIPQTSHPPTCRPSPFAVSIPLLLLRSEDTELGLVSCSRGTRIVLQYIEDPKLTVMLSYMDRSMVNLHLMHTSYFLFFMVMTLLCCGIIRGRYRSMKSHTSEKTPNISLFHFLENIPLKPKLTEESLEWFK
ncbi:transmembrane protein 248-like isoform X1 [Tachypleus tridentatus]|uniref:transmembrane protein 248-like isoform X1 n=1 Tax=Tachypleus tridentatus TaxID=6853 RepID=UPI003FD2FCA9